MKYSVLWDSEEEIIFIQGLSFELCNQGQARFGLGKIQVRSGSAGVDTMKAGKCNSVET